MTIQELIADIPKLLAYALCIVSLLHLFIIFFSERKTINVDLRGKDKIWQLVELSGIVWLVMFPIVIVVSLLGIQVQTGVWISLDTIYFMNLGGKLGQQWLSTKGGNRGYTIERTTEHEHITNKTNSPDIP